jgi:predicted pyridoxine 5'-phosphate oxidase superfamily flavin-nucleotide-binding protein
MGILTEEMKRVVREQKLGYHATVSEDGTPNLSPKGTTGVWDDGHLFFVDVRSPRTVANVRRGSWVEVNVVDPFVRKGYRFKGPAVVLDRGSDEFAAGLGRVREAGVTTAAERIQAIVVIEVRQARPLVSPAYDAGDRDEAEVERSWREFYGLRPAAEVPSE